MNLPKVVIVFRYSGAPEKLKAVVGNAMAGFRSDIAKAGDKVGGRLAEKPKIVERGDGMWEIYPKIRSDDESRLDGDTVNAIADKLEAVLIAEVEAIGGVVGEVVKPVRLTKAGGQRG